MDSSITEFGIKLNLEGTGFNEIANQFKHVIREGRACGKSFDEIKDAVDRVGNAFAAFNIDKIRQLRIQLSQMLQNRSQFSNDDIRRVAAQISSYKEVIAKIDAAKNKAIEDDSNGDKGKDGVSILEGNIKKVINSYTQLKEAFTPVKIIYRWVDGIAKLNHQLRMLHYSSGLAIDALKTYGNTAKLYGGSESTVADYERRYNIQIARAQRGMGLGHLQDAYWQFGFSFDINESAQSRFRRAIEAASRMNEADREAFAQLEAPGREKELLAWAKRGVGAYDKLTEYQRKIAEMKTVGGEKLTDAVSKESEALAESENKLAAQFEALKNEIAVTLLPIVRMLTDIATSVVESFNKLPPGVKKLVIAIGAFIAAIYTTIKVLAAIRRIKALFGAIETAGSSVGASAASSVGGAAGGAGAGAGATAAAGAGALAASIAAMVISAIGSAGLGFVIKELSESVLEPWYTAWKAYAMAQGADYDDKRQYLMKYMVDGGLTEEEAAFLYTSGAKQGLHREQMFHDDELMYKKLNELVTTISSNSEAVLNRGSDSYIHGDVNTNNDNRSINITQHFVSSGDMQRDAQIAASEANSIGFGNSVNSTSER